MVAARTRTVEQLIAGGRRKADMAAETTRHTDADLLLSCNAGIAFVARTLAATQGYSFFGRTWYEMGPTTASPQGGEATPQDVVIGGSPFDEYSVVARIVNVDSPTAIGYTISVDGGETVAVTGDFDDSVGDDVLVPGTGVVVSFPPVLLGEYQLGQVYTAETCWPRLIAGMRWRALPSDVMHVHSVAIRYGGGTVPLAEATAQDETLLEDDTVWPQTQYPLKYRFRGAATAGENVSTAYGPKMDLYPRPKSNFELILKYTPHPGRLAAGESWDGICGHEDAVETWIARDIFRTDQQGEWYDRMNAELAKWEADLRVAARRVTGEPARVAPRAPYASRLDPRLRILGR